MPLLLSSSPELQVLSIGLDVVSSEAGEVVCFFKAIGSAPTENGPAWRVPSSEVGLPQHLDRRAERAGSYEFRMPGRVIDEIRGHLAPGHPLWLRLERPAGYLAAVPWERIFQPELGVPILRLPEVEAALPLETPTVLDVLLCASDPVAKAPIDVTEHLVTAMGRIRDALQPRSVRFHVFVDQGFYVSPALQQWNGRNPDDTLYDPQTAASYAVPEANEQVRETQGQLTNPWLLWMRDSLQKRSVDVAHFLCHGYFSFERGALCFAESPLQNTDQRVARFVGAGELGTFLTQVGAWSTVFSSPPGNYSEIGLRLLSDTLPQVRPGPMLLHDLPCDLTCRVLGDAYRFLHAPQPGQPPASPALALRCQPSRMGKQAAPEEPDSVFRGGFRGGFILGFGGPSAEPELESVSPASGQAPEDPLASVFTATDNVPSWIAAATRYVEQQTVLLRREAAGAHLEASKADPVAETLRQIRDIVTVAAHERSGEKS